MRRCPVPQFNSLGRLVCAASGALDLSRLSLRTTVPRTCVALLFCLCCSVCAVLSLLNVLLRPHLLVASVVGIYLSPRGEISSAATPRHGDAREE